MGWYRAVGRRFFFAMEPETAHSMARALLSVPLPWRRIGGAPRDPRLTLDLAGVGLENPIGLAAGFDKRGDRTRALGALGFGYVVAGTFTLRPRPGNEKPRVVRIQEQGAVVNAMGMPNPGAEEAARLLARGRRGRCPRFASLADEAIEDAARALELLDPHVDGFELNASSPNAGWAHEVSHVGVLTRELVARTRRPVFVKLPPFTNDEERRTVLAMAEVAQSGGAAALTCSNTIPVEEPRLARGRGGLSGRPLAARTPTIVREVRSATGGALPINACGGLSSAAEALACLDAGATTVQLYTSLLFEGPGVVGAIARGLARELSTRGTSMRALVA